MPRKPKKTARKTTIAQSTTKSKPTRQTTLKKTTTNKGESSINSTHSALIIKRKPLKAAKKINIGNLKQAYTKSQIISYIAESTELTKKDISNFFDALSYLMEHHLKSKSGPGEFTIPGLMKCVVKRKPATKARKGTNPFTGEAMTFKAKPARNTIKVRPLKKLKEMAN